MSSNPESINGTSSNGSVRAVEVPVGGPPSFRDVNLNDIVISDFDFIKSFSLDDLDDVEKYGSYPTRWGSFELLLNRVIEHREVTDKSGTSIIKAPICSWLRVYAQSRDEASGDWGIVLRWRDPDDHRHTWCMPRTLLEQGGTELYEILARAGVNIEHGEHKALRRYLRKALFETKTRMRSVHRCGWYDNPHGQVYVMADRVVGEMSNGEGVVFQSESYDKKAYPAVRAGSVLDWQSNVSCYCIGNSLLIFAVSAALAAPTLKLLKEPSGGFHLRSQSSRGKTTTLMIAESVWGHEVGSWRTTDNALENLAESRNDGLLTLDELALVRPEVAGESAYMLGNESGKNRMDGKTSTSQRIRRWRVLFLSTGEISLVDHAAEAGKRLKAGSEVRMVELDANADPKFGCFQNIHSFEDGAKFSKYLQQASKRYCGLAGPMWVNLLLEHPPAVQTLAKIRDEFIASLRIPSDASGEIFRVAGRFAVVAAAGEVASIVGITGWNRGTALFAARWCFERWCSGRVSLGASDIDRAVEQVRAFLLAHGESRFRDLTQKGADSDRPVINRAGWKRTKNGMLEYLITPTAFRNEICRGHDYKIVAQELAQRGYLQRGEDRLEIEVRLPEEGKIRVYLIRASILEGSSSDEAKAEPMSPV